jgi:phosphatidylglycerol:prolipoprotein diacylglycerol transferase
MLLALVIPYFASPSLDVGPLHLELFGIFVALGVGIASWISQKQAEKDGLDSRPMQDFALWGVGMGVVVGHWFHLLAYHHEEITSIWSFFRVWSGLSSFGGLIGGILGAAIYFRKSKVKMAPYLDALALAVAVGWGIARIGCFVVHDHPGVFSHSFLAVNFPVRGYGGPRLDLGLIDAIWLFFISGVLFSLRKMRKLDGRLMALLALMYGCGRFTFDFFRAQDLSYVDARYFGLTPAQYLSVVLVGYGIFRLIKPAAGAQHPNRTAQQTPSHELPAA